VAEGFEALPLPYIHMSVEGLKETTKVYTYRF
jgi:hypothetical protein